MKYLLKFFFVTIVVSMSVQVYGYNAAKVKKLLKFAQSSTAQNQVLKFAGADFRGVKLPFNLDLRGSFMPGVVFSPCLPNDVNKQTPMVCIADQKSDLTGINFANSNLSNASFDKVIAVKGNFTGVDFRSSSAIEADFTGAQLQGMQTQDATFCNAIMPDGKKCTDDLKVWSGQNISIVCNCGTPPEK